MAHASAQEAGDLMAIAASGHGTPAAAMCSGVIIKKQPARQIGAAPDGRFRTFHQEFSGGTSDGGEQPLEPFFAGDELKTPSVPVREQFIVAFGDAKNLVNRLHPVTREGLTFHDGSKDCTEGLAKA